MKIAALIKQVPDTATKIVIKPDRSGIDEAGIKFILNPYDEFAVEEAIKTKEQIKEGETVVISMGPERTVEALRTALAMGMDKAIHIDNEGKNDDSFSTARILANLLKDRGFDIIFCGKQAIDGDNAQVVSMIAEFLNLPQVTIIEKFEVNADKKGALVTRRMSGGAKEIYDVSFPAVFACEKGLNTPRYASLPGIMKAKTKPIEKIKSSDLASGVESKVEFVNYSLPPEKIAGKKIEGEPAEQAAALVRLLREEAKII